MKLYYAPGTCSLAPHIVAKEAGLTFQLVRVDIGGTPHRTSTGRDYTAINPKGYVPALELDNGELLTEGAAILQYLADRAPEAQLAPPAGTLERYRLQEWLTFVSSELHKMFSPWLFHPEHGTQAQAAARAMIARRFAFLDRHLERSRYLLGAQFTVADAYCFAIVRWSRFGGVSLEPHSHLKEYMARIEARPSVQAALRAEGLALAA